MALAVIVLIIASTRQLISTMAELLIVICSEWRLTVSMLSAQVAMLAPSIPSPSAVVIEWCCMVLHLLHRCFRCVPLES